jgi:hypothetical protein
MTSKRHTNLRPKALLLSILSGLTLALLGASPASAKVMTVYSCHDPAGNGLGHSGWNMFRTGDLYMTIADNCSNSGQGALQLALGPNGAGYPGFARVEWMFSAPSWGSITAYTLKIGEDFAAPPSPGEGQTYVTASDESDPIYDFRNLGGGLLATPTVERTPRTPVSWILADASCDGEGGRCGSGITISRLNLTQATIRLNDNTNPTVSGVAGPLASGSSQRGERELTFQAADPGPGVYSSQLVIDGTPQPAAIFDTNEETCKDLGQTTDGTRAFSTPEPCSPSISTDATLNTAQLTDGTHTVKLLVYDASGNSTVGWTGSITTVNAPADSAAPAVLTPSGTAVGATLTGQPGGWSAPSGAGAITYAYQWQSCDAAGANCKAIPGAEGTSYTPAPADIGHTLALLVHASDNDGTATAASSAVGPVESNNQLLSASNGPGTGPGTSQATNTTIINNTSNGLLQSEPATVLHLGVPHTITRSFAKRAMKITGRLTDALGHPITGATLDILQRVTRTSNTSLTGHVSTGTGGTFTATVPAGPSRAIEIAYRPSPTSSYTAIETINETVAAGAHLKIKQRSVANNAEIQLSGTIAGPIPHGGTLVELLVHYRGQWVPFRRKRTNSHGAFHAAYKFQGSIGRFPFKAEIPAGQVGFPYARGYSNTINVNTH